MTFDAARTLAELLTVARQSGCGCPVCTELRAMWTHLDLDLVVRDQRGEVPRPGSICPACWTAPGLEHVRRGGAGVATLTAGTGRCAMCGMPVRS